MTDKLADAARKLIDRWETPAWKDVPATGEFINSLSNALTAHEAAKAATPDDVLPFDLRVGAGTYRKGVKVKLAQDAIDRLWGYLNEKCSPVSVDLTPPNTPDDVREAVDFLKQTLPYGLGGSISKAIDTVSEAALRQGVTLPREVVEKIRQALTCDPDPPEYIGSKYKEALSLLDQHARGG